jgi:hypothetical protein
MTNTKSVSSDDWDIKRQEIAARAKPSTSSARPQERLEGID